MANPRAPISLIIAAILLCAFGSAAPPEARAQTCPPADVKQTRPTQMGVSGGSLLSIGSKACCSGTLGSLVKNTKGAQFILSNNHVLARESNTQRGAVHGER